MARRGRGISGILAAVTLIGSLALTARTAHAAGPFVFDVTSTADVHDLTPGDGVCSTPTLSPAHGACTFRAASDEADAQPAGTKITIKLHAATYLLPLGTVTFGDVTTTPAGYLPINVTVTGAGPASTIIKNTLAGNRVIDNEANLTINGVAIKGGVAPPSGPSVNGAGEGGGIFSNGLLAMTNDLLDTNTATGTTPLGLGGGLYQNGDNGVTITNTTFNKNSAIQGGAIFADSGAFVLTGDTFTGNNAMGSSRDDADGGAVFIDSDSMTIINSTFTGNGAPLSGTPPLPEGNGGAIYVDTRASIIGGSITKNSANGYGGGLYENNGVLTMQGTSVTNNIASSGGGGIDTEDFASLASLVVTGNTAGAKATMSLPASTGSGGGLYVNYKATITNSIITSNQAIRGVSTDTSEGGGVYNNDNSSWTGDRIQYNVADDGGGMYENRDAVSFQQTLIANNTANHDGGGVYEDNSTTDTTANLILHGSSIVNNKAGHDGGGLFSNTDPSITAILNQGSFIQSNTAGHKCPNAAQC
jgi:predicted outer membrane repeat protein